LALLLQSSYDKLFYWKNNVEWLKDFANTQNQVPLALLNILVLELITEILSVVGCIELFINNGRVFGYYGAVCCMYYLIDAFGPAFGQGL
jgi:hypothetical protein